MCELQQARQFEYMNEGSIDPELKCSICTDPFIDPVCISACNHTFCRLDNVLNSLIILHIALSNQ